MDQDDLNPSDDIVVDEELEAPAGAIKKLRAKLKVCENERAEYLAGWQRAKADLINEKRQFDDERRALLDRSLELVLGRFFILADHFESAMAAKEAWAEAPPNWRQGIEGIYRELLSIFKEYGVEPEAPAVGELFDPARDHSVGTVSGGQEGTIAQVIQKGYRRNGKILRPTQVKVFNS